MGSLCLGQFIDDPDYLIVWPNDVLQDELRRLIRRAQRNGAGSEWHDEVRTLLRQAFASGVPVDDDFTRVANSSGDEEPF